MLESVDASVPAVDAPNATSPMRSLVALLSDYVPENVNLSAAVREVLQTHAAADLPFLGTDAVGNASVAIDACATPLAVASVLRGHAATHALLESLGNYTAGLDGLAEWPAAAGAPGPLRRALELIGEARAPVDSLVRLLDEHTAGLQESTTLARWVGDYCLMSRRVSSSPQSG